MQRVLFLCTGNFYRSRFAEIFFNWHAERLNLGWRAESRGLALDPCNLGPLSRYTVARLESHGIPFDAYRRLPLDVTTADFDAAQRVVAVKRAEHHPLIQRRFPACLDWVEFWDIHDLDCSEPHAAMPLLEQKILDLLRRLGEGSVSEGRRTVPEVRVAPAAS